MMLQKESHKVAVKGFKQQWKGANMLQQQRKLKNDHIDVTIA